MATAKSEKKPVETAEPAAPAAPASALDLTAHLDPTIRRQVQGVLLADPSLSLEAAVRKVTQAIADGILSKPTPGDLSAKTRTEDLAPPKGTKVAVRRLTGGEFGYHGRTMDRGQVFELMHLDGTGARDAQLVRLGYLTVLAADARTETCGACGAMFTDATCANAHYARRHVPEQAAVPKLEPRRPGESLQEYEQRETAFRAAIIAQEIADEEKGDRAEDARAPLHLDQTRASRT